MDDFPAAHSMDTTWFAVDQDGHVASLDSGEAGGVPATVDPEMHHEIEERVLDAAALSQLHEAIERGEDVHATGASSLVLLVRDAAPLRARLASAPHRLLDLEDGVALVLDAAAAPKPSLLGRLLGRSAGPGWFVELVKAIHDEDLCRGCAERLDAGDFMEAPTLAGVYAYRHESYGEVLMPYTREDEPDRALHVDELPLTKEQRDALVKLEGVCFDDALNVQPAEHAKVESWASECAFVRRDGKTVAPMPGREKEYGELYARRDSLEVETDEPLDFTPPRAS